MKKLVVALFAALLLTGCGVGSYSVSSGKADEGMLSFTSAKAENIVVTVDNDTFELKSVKDKVYKADRRIKQTSQNTIYLVPGTHDVKVEIKGQTVYTKKLFISASEHKIVEL